MSGAPVRIERPRAAGPGRVEALVDGAPVWFEADPAAEPVALAASPEAFASAFLVPALHHRRPLQVEARVDPGWAANVRRLEGLVRRAWGYRRQPIRLRTDSAPEPAGGRGTGLFFTCGVDSFYALLRSGESPEVLINVHGFDVALDDGARQCMVRRAVAEVAAATGRRAVFLRTNLREHPLIRSMPWDASHGGALAAAAHVLSNALGRVAIASSQPRWSVNPWGSHWQTDPLWSGTALEIVHLDPDIDRLDKIRRIADDPLVRHHLRVCWKEIGTRLNCSRCEKCMLTMLALETTGHRLDFETFEPLDLLQLVRERRRSAWRLPMLNELASSRSLDPVLRRALRAMWWRSVLWRSKPLRWMAGVGRLVRGNRVPR